MDADIFTPWFGRHNSQVEVRVCICISKFLNSTEGGITYRKTNNVGTKYAKIPGERAMCTKRKMYGIKSADVNCEGKYNALVVGDRKYYPHSGR
jgi:hypothetical protein